MIATLQSPRNMNLLGDELYRIIQSVASPREFLFLLSAHYGVHLDIDQSESVHWQAPQNTEGSVVFCVMRMAFGGRCGTITYKSDLTLQRALNAFVQRRYATGRPSRRRRQLSGLSTVRTKDGESSSTNGDPGAHDNVALGSIYMSSNGTHVVAPTGHNPKAIPYPRVAPVQAVAKISVPNSGGSSRTQPRWF
jgi:hypothetical protein